MTDRTEAVLRLSMNERIQHLALMICVLVLMATGLSLRFADTWFGRAVIALEGGIEARGFLHRMSAVGLILLCTYHALYAIFTERGHGQLMAILPGLQDFRDLVTALKFSLGATEEGPRFGRFDFRQKFQYWAVALGATLMVLTGMVLWFESESMAVMPKWIIDVTRISHSGEGLLIFVVLFLWHLYDTHLRPGIFPMDGSWVTGRLTVEELKERHPMEYERLFGGTDREEGESP